MPDKELKVVVLMKLSELQEIMDKSTKSGKQYINEIKSLTEIEIKKRNKFWT